MRADGMPPAGWDVDRLGYPNSWLIYNGKAYLVGG